MSVQASAENQKATSQSGTWLVAFWSMVAIQFMMAMAQTIVTPILPIFLPQIGVTGQSHIEFFAGELNATGYMVAAVATPLWRRMGDRSSRKLMVMRCSLAIRICDPPKSGA